MAGVAHAARRTILKFRVLGENVRRQLPFKQRDLILDHQFAFFQSLQLQLIDHRRLGEAENYVVEITMLQLELGDARFDGVDLVEVGQEWCRGQLRGSEV